eukprot:20926-Heterococcus_DN1.PRE.1
MAFASLQQAISLDPQDFVAYLKLGTLYEQLATTAAARVVAALISQSSAQCIRSSATTTVANGVVSLCKYEEAGGHAVKCYQYYLDGTHSEDTDVLTRLGNLQDQNNVRTLYSLKRLSVYCNREYERHIHTLMLQSSTTERTSCFAGAGTAAVVAATTAMTHPATQALC